MFVISRSFLIKDTLLFFYIQLYSHRVVASTYTPAGYTFEGGIPPLYCKNEQNKKVIYYEDLNFTIILNGKYVRLLAAVTFTALIVHHIG